MERSRLGCPADQETWQGRPIGHHANHIGNSQILWPLRGRHPEAVFTYVEQRTLDKVVKGKRYSFIAGER
jgi:hypothetical protein